MTVGGGARGGRRAISPQVGHYIHTVLNPWTSTPCRALTADPSVPHTNILRRMNTVSFSYEGATDLTEGLEVLVVLNGARDPYVFCAANLGGTPRVQVLGRDRPDNASIPPNSYARVVGAGVKITYDGTAVNRGGKWYHFAYSREMGGTSLFEAPQWGSATHELNRAVSMVDMIRHSEAMFVTAPESGFVPITIKPDDMFMPTWPAPTENVSIMRLLYKGPTVSCTFTMEIAEALEYFHLSHRHMARPTFTHPQALSVHQTLSTHLQASGSGASSPQDSRTGGFSRFVRAASGVIETVLTGAGTIMRGAAAFQAGADAISTQAMLSSRGRMLPRARSTGWPAGFSITEV